MGDQEEKKSSDVAENNKVEYQATNYVDYIRFKTMGIATVATMLGTSWSYINGNQSVPISFYSYLMSSTLVSVSFFSTTYACQVIREKPDDFINYAIAGGLHAGLAGVFKYGKKGLMGVLIGAGFGAATFQGAVVGYKEARSVWINYRRNLKESTAVNLVPRPTFTFPPVEERTVVRFFESKTPEVKKLEPPSPTIDGQKK